MFTNVLFHSRAAAERKNEANPFLTLLLPKVPNEEKNSANCRKTFEVTDLEAVKQCGDSYGSVVVEEVSYSKVEKKTQ